MTRKLLQNKFSWTDGQLSLHKKLIWNHWCMRRIQWVELNGNFGMQQGYLHFSRLWYLAKIVRNVKKDRKIKENNKMQEILPKVKSSKKQFYNKECVSERTLIGEAFCNKASSMKVMIMERPKQIENCCSIFQKGLKRSFFQ